MYIYIYLIIKILQLLRSGGGIQSIYMHIDTHMHTDITWLMY